MVSFRGKRHFHQYVPKKSHRYGVKLYKLCTPEGYMNNIFVYTGKGITNESIDHSQPVVIKLSKRLNKKKEEFYTLIIFILE